MCAQPSPSGGPSEKAIEAVVVHMSGSGDWSKAVPGILAAAHDPALGPDRSVCLRDVVDKLNDYANAHRNPQALWFASFLLQEFGGEG